MAKKRIRVYSVKDPKRPAYKWGADWRDTEGKRHRHYFATKGEATLFAGEKEAEFANIGFQAAGLSNAQRIEATACYSELKPFDASLTDAVRHYIAHLKATQRSCKVRDAVAEAIARKKADGLSKVYIDDFKLRVEAFAKDFGDEMVSSITTPKLNDWLTRLPVKPETRNGYRRNLIVFFSYCVAQGYVEKHPATKTSIAKVVDSPPGILTPAAMNALLALVKKHSPESIPGVMIQGLAGLRTAETKRLEWKDIRWESALIEVSARKAKTAQRRFVPICPVLMSWLSNYKNETGYVTERQYPRKLAPIRKQLAEKGFEFAKNALRHSFATYHLAENKDAAKTALELGHKTTDMLFRHYRELATDADAAKWWAIAPIVSGNKRLRKKVSAS